MCPTRVDAVEKRFCGLERTTTQNIDSEQAPRTHGFERWSWPGPFTPSVSYCPAIVIRPSTSSNSQKVSNPASDVTAEP
jgi:hypothetical protein